MLALLSRSLQKWLEGVDALDSDSQLLSKGHGHRALPAGQIENGGIRLHSNRPESGNYLLGRGTQLPQVGQELWQQGQKPYVGLHRLRDRFVQVQGHREIFTRCDSVQRLN